MEAPKGPGNVVSFVAGMGLSEAKIKTRRRPTLPGPEGPSTIGAGGLNCRVRDGTGCFPAAICRLESPAVLRSE
jgi:hypothetical protein